MNRKRIVALILAAVMALPSHVYAAPAAPDGADVPLLEKTDVQAGMPETEDGQTEAPEVEESKEEAPVEDTGNVPAEPAGSEELAEPKAPTLDIGNAVDVSEEDPVTGTEDAVGAGEGSEDDSAQEPAAVTYDLWIGGAQVTDQNLSGVGWEYDPGNRTLKLNDAELNNTGDSLIKVEGNLTVTGTGTLSTDGVVFDQVSGEKLTFKNANLKLDSTGDYLIMAEGAVDIVDSIIKDSAKEEGYGIFASGSFHISGSEIVICSKNDVLHTEADMEITNSVIDATSTGTYAINAVSVHVSGKSHVTAESKSTRSAYYAVRVSDVEKFTYEEGRLQILDNAEPNKSKKLELNYAYLVTVNEVYGEGDYSVGEMNSDAHTYTGYYSSGKSVTIWTGVRSKYVLKGVSVEGVEEGSLSWAFKDQEVEARTLSFNMPGNDVTITLNWERIDNEPEIIGDFKVNEDGELIGVKDENTILPSVVKIPSEVTKISAGVFDIDVGRNVTEVTFDVSSHLIEIGDNAFKNSKLKKIKFESRLERIGNGAFDSCSDLVTVTMPKGVKNIGVEAFQNCAKLSEIDVSLAETIGSQAFENCKALTNDVFIRHEEPTLKQIGDYAFRYCIGLDKKLDLNGKMAEPVAFGMGVFEGCNKLTEVNLPDGLIEIPEDTFKNCVLLKSVVIPESVAAVRRNAFAGCIKLEDVSIYNHNGPQDSSAIILVETSFPNREQKLTLAGYGGTVENHAEDMNYKYAPLFDKYTIITDKSDEKGDILLSNSLAEQKAEKLEAYVGDKLYVRLKPKVTENGAEYWVRPGYVKTDGFDEFKLEKIDGNDVIYSFVLKKPKRGTTVTVYGKFGTVKKMNNNLTVDVKDCSYIDAQRDGSGNLTSLNFKKPGKEVKLILRSGIYPDDLESAPWMFELTSDKPKVASIDKDGTLRSIGTASESTCTITIKSRVEGDETERKIIVNVYGKANPEKIQFSSFNDLVKGDMISDDSSGFPVIRFNSRRLTQKSISFEAELEALDGDEESVLVPASWSVTDNSIADIASTETSNNKNRIIIKKGAVGETSVNVTVKRTDGKEALTTQFIIQIVDATPRLKEGTITVNSNSTYGASFTLVPVYGYDIDENSLVLKRLDKDSGVYLDVDDFNISQGRIRSKYKGQTGTHEKELWIEGNYTDECGGGTFHRVINKLVVNAEKPNPTITKTGKINLFYLLSDDPDTGVTIKQSLKGEKVIKYELVSARHHKKWDSWKDLGEIDQLETNFSISKPDKDGNAIITRKAVELEKIKKKVVLSGYIYIYYEGYEEPVKKSITIPTTTTKPSYILSMTKATFNNNAVGQDYEIKLQDKKTKDTINLTGAEVSLGDKSSKAIKKVAPQVVVNENGNLYLKFDGTPVKGKVVFSVKKPSWSTPLTYNFTLNSTKSVPKLKFSTSTVNFRPITDSGVQTATVKVTWNQVEANLMDLNFNSGRDAISFEQTGPGVGVITIRSEGTLSLGSSKYTAMPRWEYKGAYGSFYPKNPVKLTVKVTDKKVSMSLSGKDDLNLLDRDTPAVYKVKTSNIYGDIGDTDIRVEEYDSERDIYKDASRLFEAKADKVEGTISIYAKKGDEAKFFKGGSDKIPGNSYKVRVVCYINGMKIESKALKIKVTQKLPTFELDQDSLNMYAGERYFADKVHEIKVTKKTQKSVKVAKIDWAKDATKAYKDAIEIVGYNQETEKLTLKLKNAARLKMNTEYTLPFVAVCEGQMIELDEKDKEIPSGKNFSIKIKIKK